ncbi:calcium-transporting P-type ATPase, PMR1-type [Pneumocystis jirovecii RU7]|uniref:Calcium-transporting ATPase n=1 Tax=Pneumocystis jirovecii (strain RU7) TaxID=1408657 RepID=A0A0W4ZS19_PNEJ7|nr:calcium-transporting P-type ATPase, PMR1-type [Pneumocystis jirovecii RU7]KTW31154.1 calcium-transporting P-type ATPase, PMR1-type [Pneumocystis jirovecii RU7]
MPVKPSDKLGNSWNHDSFSEICLKTDFFRSSVEECCALLHTSWKTGLLTHEDILYRQSIYGINKTTIESNESLFFRFFKQLTDNFLMMLLLISALISLFVGNVNDAVSIIIALIMVVSVGFLQEYHSEKSLKALNNMVSYNCHVIRNGENQYIAASELVPGDLIKFSIGDRIPADLRITEAIDLELDESNLTGETNAVCKNTDALREDRLVVPISEQRCIGFMGTLVKHGSGSGIVIRTGKNTEFGSIFEDIQRIKSPRTPLQKSMDELGKQLSLFSIIVIVIISLTGLLQGRSWLEMSTITISLAVAAVPEGLPIIVSVTLALGVHRMANKKAIVKNLPSVETLGSVNIMCCDKTGTLTENHMTIQKIFTLGEDGLIDISSDLKKPLFTNDKTLKCLLNIANLCNNARKSNNRKFIGQSVDVAIMELIERYGYNDNRMVYTRTQEIPFSSNRKWMSVTAYPSSMTPSLSSVYVKGSYEEIRMKSVSALEKNAIEIPLTKDIIEKFDRAALNMASEGLRVIALASLSSSSNQGLTIAGLIGLHDPLKKDIKESIQRLLQNSIRVVIITGDSEATALSTAYNIGIPIQYPKSHKINQGYQQFENVISGNSFEKMTNKQLSEAISNINIFARTTPRHKMKIIEAFQTRGNIVAMIGDGVNDAPALKLANIGIAMGKYGTDVAREAADMILTDDSFSTILNAIEEGKGIYHNISAFITFQLSTSIAALSLVSFAVIFGFQNPLTATQILWINILMDGPPAQSLSCESIHSNVISNHPREKNTPLLTTALLKKVFISAFLIVFGTFFIYIFEINRSTERKSTTMAFTCFVFFDIFNVLTCRSNTKSIFNIGFFSNHMFNLAILGSFLGQISVIYIPFFQRIFHTESLSLSDLLFLIVVTSSIFWADELRKLKTQKNIVKESFIAV